MIETLFRGVFESVNSLKEKRNLSITKLRFSSNLNCIFYLHSLLRIYLFRVLFEISLIFYIPSTESIFSFQGKVKLVGLCLIFVKVYPIPSVMQYYTYCVKAESAILFQHLKTVVAIRPWHNVRAIAHSRTLPTQIKKKESWAGDEKLCVLMSPAQNSKQLIQNYCN